MRMQNTDMEFVAFDAQDVIMTSTTGGGPANAWFKGVSSLVPEYAKHFVGEDLQWAWANSTTGLNESISIYINGEKSKHIGQEGESYQLTENSYYKKNGGSTYVFDATELGGADGTGTQLNTLDEITSWLTNYAKGKQ